MKKVSMIFAFFTFSFAACPEGFAEDSCGNCWMNYCYDYVTHDVFYDLNQAIVRSDIKQKNKGREAAIACINLIN